MDLLGVTAAGGDPSALIADGDPWELAAACAEFKPANLAEMRVATAQVPELRVLRAIVLSYSQHAHEECAVQLYEAARQLAVEGKLQWAEVAVRYWSELVHAMALEFPEVQRLGHELLECAPQLRAESPFTLAVVATAASAARDMATADALWDEAVHHSALGRSSDGYWRVHLLWSVHHLVPRLGNLGLGTRLIRRGRSHFTARAGAEAADQAHFASMNLAAALFLEGDSLQAVDRLAEDLRRCPPNGIHAGFLHAIHALVLADLGRITEAQESIDTAMLHVPDNNLGVQIGYLGVARLIVAGSAQDRTAAQDVIGDLLRLERAGAAYAEDRALWRIIGARCLEACGLPAAAENLLREALEISADAVAPYHAAWAELRLLGLLEPTARAELSVSVLERAVEMDAQQLVTRRERDRGSVALLCAAASGPLAPEVESFTQRALSMIGESNVMRAAARANVEDLVQSAGVQHHFERIGWTSTQIPVRNDCRLRIRLLGGFELVRDGVDISTGPEWQGRRKARLLLAHLVTAQGEFVHRDQLVSDLWEPDADAAKGPRNLRAVVYVLRRVLEPQLARNEPGRYIETAGAMYRIQLGPEVECDFEEFLDAVERARSSVDPEHAIAEAWRAVHLYGGEFLRGEDCDEWVVRGRQMCHREWRSTVVRLAELLETRGRLVEARVPLEAVNEADPASEQTCRMLMKIYAETGEPGLISDAFQRTLRYLDVELGLRPDAQTSQLYGQLISGQAHHAVTQT